MCGCFVKAKTKVIYEMTDDGLAIGETDKQSGDVFYACPEAKW
jgi:hypothetical protein